MPPAASRRPGFPLLAALAVAAAGVALSWRASSSRLCPAAGVGQVVLITGASSGIGAELAVQYGARGAHLVLAARRASELEAVGAASRAAGAASALVVPTDMDDEGAVAALVAAAGAAHGRLDVLFLNHARVDEGLFVSHSAPGALAGVLTGVLRTNVVGSALAARAALPLLAAAGGHIAVVSSASAKVAAPFHFAYVASKCALHGVFDTLRAELHLAAANVSVGLQVLGMIATAEILADPANAGLAAPVPAVAAEMICAAAARRGEVYVPGWYWWWTQVTAILGSDFAEWAMERAYLRNVPRYVQAIADERRRVAAGNWVR